MKTITPLRFSFSPTSVSPCLSFCFCPSLSRAESKASGVPGKRYTTKPQPQPVDVISSKPAMLFVYSGTSRWLSVSHVTWHLVVTKIKWCPRLIRFIFFPSSRSKVCIIRDYMVRIFIVQFSSQVPVRGLMSTSS